MLDQLLTPENIAMLVKGLLALIALVAGGFLVIYRKAINKAIKLLTALEEVTDADGATAEEIEALIQAWAELKGVFKNYTEIKIANKNGG